MPPGDDTIFALASAPGRSGVAVIRVSGAAAGNALRALSRAHLPEPRLASLRRLHDEEGHVLDEALVLWFAGPHSFTGEDIAEFHIHGGRAIRESVLEVLGRIGGLRPAEAGEFTRRAVENGRLDLTRAEAIADLVDAETPAQARQAFRQYDGALADLYEGWRRELAKALAHAEAAIDFAEDEVPEEAATLARAEIAKIIKQIQVHMQDSRRGEILREGLHLAVIGPPNAGKSSLINALARRDVAIVSDIPGTTRDVIEARLNLGGYPVIVADTAGLREAGEAIEAEGVRRALARAESADLVLLLLDGSAADPLAGLPEGAAEHADITVWNKADLTWPKPRDGIRLSLKDGEGLSDLLSALQALAKDRLEGPSEAPALTRPRHRHALEEAERALSRAQVAPLDKPELMAEDLRLALRAVGRITGRVDIEELLDIVFRDFCIGK
jgi:tRNA modification GTPase